MQHRQLFSEVFLFQGATLGGSKNHTALLNLTAITSEPFTGTGTGAGTMLITCITTVATHIGADVGI